jgi:arylsulfatase A
MNFHRLALTILALPLGLFADEAKPRPNIVIIFTDDQGYADLGCYGSEKIRTPRLDRMAAEGIRFTNFHVASSVCSASRASLLTGRYSSRHGVRGVFVPGNSGMSPDEVTLAEVLRPIGYATACIGKWHLGDAPQFLPTTQGFDTYFGIPYSNDMYIGPDQTFAPDSTFRDGWTRERAIEAQAFVKKNAAKRAAIAAKGLRDLVPLMEGKQIVEFPADQASLTRRYFDRAIDFINRATTGKKSFFIYLAPAMPHVPLFASSEFLGKSTRGLYGDTVEEIDHHVGRLLDHLTTRGLDENTLVIFSSDNGPWLGKGAAAGSSGPFRDGKFSVYEGGLRVPAIIRWPTRIPARQTSDALVSTIDLFPTLARFTHTPLPDRPLDGKDISAHLLNPSAPFAPQPFFCMNNGRPVGVIDGDWKYLPHGGAKNPTQDAPPELYNLTKDPGEKNNLAAAHPDIVARLHAILESAHSGKESKRKSKSKE